MHIERIGFDPKPPAPPVAKLVLTKSRRGYSRENPSTNGAPAPSPPQPPSPMVTCDIGLINNDVLPGRERVPPKVFDPSSPHPTKRRRGRPPTKRLPNVSCMSPKAVGGGSQIQSPCAISPVPASAVSPPSNQSNENQPFHHVTDHLGLQASRFVAASSIHKQIGSTTYMKVENLTINEGTDRREDIISGANMEPHQGVNIDFSYGVAAALPNIVFPTVESQHATSVGNQTVESQHATSVGNSDIYNVNPGFKDLLQSIVESQPVTSVINSNIYNLNSSYAETLKSIFEKHGDIAKDCTLQSPNLKTYYLEAICKDVQELQSKKLSELDYGLLNSYYLVVNDGETMKFNVKWFRDRLDEIRTAISSFVESRKNAEKMKQLEDEKRDLQLKKIELEKLISDVEATESQLAREIQLVVEDMNRSSRDLECKFKHFQDMNLMDGVL